MARKKESEDELKDNAVRGALGRGMSELRKTDEDMGICIRSTRRTFQNKRKRPALFTLGDIRRMDKILKFTDIEIISMVRGKG